MYSVIIVEDDAIVRTYLSGLLEWESHGMKVVGQFTNGREAKQFIEEQNVDIVITDVSMPVMNGIELIKYIKKTEKIVKIIVLSCHSDYDFIREALKCGVSDYILKQYLTKENLLELLEKLIGELEINKDSVIWDKEADQAIKSNLLKNIFNGIIRDQKKYSYYILTLEDEKNLLRAITEENINEAVVLIESYLNKFKTEYEEANTLKAWIIDLVNILTRIAMKCEINLQVLFEIDYIPYEEIESKQNIDDIKNWFVSIIKKIVYINNEKNNLYRSEILKAVDYIEKHCTEDIFLRDVANHVNISPNYFSMIFKKEMGVVFSEFLLNIRLEKSKILLKKKGIKIYEVAYKAGFNNNQYFNRIFKQKYGVTPLAFKRQGEQLEKGK